MNGRLPELRVLRLIWWGFALTVVLYVGVCGLSVGAAAERDLDLTRSLRIVFALAALSLAATSIWWRRVFATSSASPFFLFVHETADPSAREQALTTAVQRLQTNCLVVWAMSEAVAIFGLVLCIVSHQISEYLPFGAAGLVLLYAHRLEAWPVGRILDGSGVPS